MNCISGRRSLWEIEDKVESLVVVMLMNLAETTLAYLRQGKSYGDCRN